MRAWSWSPYESLSESRCVCLALTGRQVIIQARPCSISLDQETCYITKVIMCTRGSDRNLTCGDGTNLDGYGVMAAIDDFSMVIITLGHLYSVLSCRSTSPDACLRREGNVWIVGFRHLGRGISHQGIVFKVP
jgi:hypothetical protein